MTTMIEMRQNRFTLPPVVGYLKGRDNIDGTRP
jgi:hypothetical protein